MTAKIKVEVEVKSTIQILFSSLKYIRIIYEIEAIDSADERLPLITTLEDC
jgi:hypothetical protein